ncbi:MAG: PTS sugar transporter subunit IIA [bacterium]|nr:PTS sugar transporter subunit IIA [bacterium]
MRAVDLLRPEDIVLDPPWRSFQDTVAGLVDVLVRAGSLPAAAAPDAVRAVLAREREASTAVLDVGVAVPHARLAGLAAPMIAMAVASRGLYEAVPTVPIRVVAMVLSPPAALDDHLRILGGLATLLRSPELRGELQASGSAERALTALGRHARSAP